MYFNVTGDTHPPEFVIPTPPNNQKYTIYVGGAFHVNVYAKPTLNTRYELKLCISAPAFTIYNVFSFRLDMFGR